MTANTSAPAERVTSVDALRGFAIVSILLLHNLEHFDFWYSPELPQWLMSIDKIVWDTMFFLFSGKSYAIFALLFGFTFFVQFSNQQKKGKDFRWRFAWRLLLLMGFGLINSAFYQGDILLIYAIIGFVLIPVAKLNNKTLVIIASILMFQPYEWFKVFSFAFSSQCNYSDPVSWTYFGKMSEYITGTSFIDTITGNLTNGKAGVFLWTWENGRVFQTAALFMFGLLAARKGIFTINEDNKKYWGKVFPLAFGAFFILYSATDHILKLTPNKCAGSHLEVIMKSYSNMAFMVFLVSLFLYLYNNRKVRMKLKIFTYPGRMSLSNYIFQSVIGATLYYGFGFGLYKYTGATQCLVIGIVISLLLGFFSYYRLKKHRQGPLESIWHKLTWINFNKS